MKLKLIHILPVIALLFLDGSCKPDEEYHNIQEPEVSIFKHGVGSWWIYENDSTHIRDTVFLSSFSSLYDQRNEMGSQPTIFSEYYSIYYLSNFYSTEIVQQIDLSVNDCPRGLFAFPGDSILNYNYCLIDMSGCSIENLSRIDHPSLSLGGSTYNNVTEIVNSDFKFAGQSKIAHFFFLQNVGLIKWYLENSDTCWSMVEFQLN